jgi:hypothetical protein
MSTDFERQTPEELREQAAERPCHYFLGEKLEPFSLGRQMALQRIGTSGSELENALLLIFLCSTPVAVINQLTRDPEGIEKYRAMMEEWGAKKGLNIGATVGPDGRLQYSGENTRQLVERAEEIWAETDASSFKSKNAPPDNPDPNASSRDSAQTTRRKSRQLSRR